MRERGVAMLFLFLSGIVFFAGYANAQNNDYSEMINKAYVCLDDRIDDSLSITLQEATFSMMAQSRNFGVSGKVVEKVNSSKLPSENCWSSSTSCNVKETAQVAIAKRANGEDVTEIINWLKNQTGIPADLEWYLQITIEGNKQASCIIQYEGGSSSVTVNEDLTVEGNFGNCFSSSQNGYWLKINDACVERRMDLSCNWDGESNERFLTNLVYKQPSSAVIYVSSGTKTSPRGGIHDQRITARCFKQGGSCNYEASLWATSAIHHYEGSVQEYLPYLLGLAESNKQFFPDAFLLKLTGGTSSGNHYASITDKVSLGHWDIAGGYNKHIDTGLAMIALGGINSAVVSQYGVPQVFLERDRTEAGCWSNDGISETAFLLYASGMPYSGTINETNLGGGGTPPGGVVGNGSINGTNGTGGFVPPYEENCEIAGYYCGGSLACLNAGGNVLPPSYICSSWADSCCSTRPESLPTCASLGGDICQFEERCTSSETQADDGSCCVQGICQKISSGETPGTGGTGTSGSDEKKSRLWIWITLLTLLIGMVLLGIIYRDKIRLWFYKRKGKVKSSSFEQGGAPPMMVQRRPPPRFGQPAPPRFMPAQARARPQQQPVQRSSGSKDREMEETLRKLKDISK